VCSKVAHWIHLLSNLCRGRVGTCIWVYESSKIKLFPSRIIISTCTWMHTIRSVPGSAIRDPVSSRPSESERLSHRLIGPHSQAMFIMADLRKMDRLARNCNHFSHQYLTKFVYRYVHCHSLVITHPSNNPAWF
jgi:hypothetical protein